MTMLGSSRPDDSELAAHFRTHRDALVRMAYLVIGDLARAEDTVVDACVRVLIRRRRHPIDDLGAYLRRAVINEAISAGRRRDREAGLASRVGQSLSSADHVEPDGLSDRSVLWPTLLMLPPRQRAVIVLRHVEGLSERQTAEWLGLSVGTVKAQSSRGLARLREELNEVDEHG